MKLKSVLPFVAGLIIMQSCSTPKNDIMWVGGIKTECDSGAGKAECLNVFKGEDLKDEKWENMHASIEGFEFEEGVMKKIEVQKEDIDAKDVPADASSIRYTLVKELERKADPRIELKGNWVLATINDGSINRMVVLPTLNFNLKEMRISGNGGCNLYSASITELTSKKLEIQESLGTLMACDNENIENDYHQALSKVATYELKKDMLSFYDKDGKVILSYLKVDTSKTNEVFAGDWKNTRIDGEKFEAESIPVMFFDMEKMIVGGKDGCNSYNAEIKNLSNSALLFGNIASTKMMCPEMEIADKFLAALNSVVSYKVSGNELVMLNEDGNEVLAFTK